MTFFFFGGGRWWLWQQSDGGGNGMMMINGCAGTLINQLYKRIVQWGFQFHIILLNISKY